MNHTEDRGDYIEVTEDQELAYRLAAGQTVTFRVLEDEWTELDSKPVRTIKRVEIVGV